MPRLNVDDSIWRDTRFQDLLLAVGDRHKAKGLIVELWALAQQYWVPNKKLMPYTEFEKMGLITTIDVGLAERRGDFVYAKGSEEAFDWLIQRSEAGKKGGPAAAKARVKNIEEKSRRDTTKNNGTKRDTSSSSFSSSFSFSDSSSFSNSPSPSNSKTGETTPTSTEDGARPRSSIVWDAYREAYQERYGTQPTMNAKVASQIKAFVGRVPHEDGPEIAKFYLTHNSAFYVKCLHPVGCLLKDAEKLRTEWKTGNKMLTTTARQVEFSQHNMDVWTDAAQAVKEREERRNAK